VTALSIGPDGLFLRLKDGYAKSGLAIAHHNPDLELGNLQIEVSGLYFLAERFDAVHLRSCAASSMISGQLLLEERPNNAFGFADVTS
jgi:hypothetical protein